MKYILFVWNLYPAYTFDNSKGNEGFNFRLRVDQIFASTSLKGDSIV